MYRIKVLSSGEHIYTALGYRYCLRKKDAINLINDYVKQNNCEITLEKFIHIYSTIFCWANDDENDKVFKYYNNLFNPQYNSPDEDCALVEFEPGRVYWDEFEANP